MTDTSARRRPAAQVCPICGYDDDVTLEMAAGEWVMTCSFRRHPPYEWRPVDQLVRRVSYRSGLGEELGVYDDLLECVIGGFAEYGVIEHRFSQRAPETYKFLVDRYGHTALGPSRYTTSAFLGGALGQLWREGSVESVWGPATGYWAYNGSVGAYAAAGEGGSEEQILHWETFANDQLRINPFDWPPLGYRVD